MDNEGKKSSKERSYNSLPPKRGQIIPKIFGELKQAFTGSKKGDDRGNNNQNGIANQQRWSWIFARFRLRLLVEGTNQER